MLLDQNINNLKLDTKLTTLLNNNNFSSIRDLWNTTRKELKRIGLNDQEINQIRIKLQLQGIDFNHKIYSQK